MVSDLLVAATWLGVLKVAWKIDLSMDLMLDLPRCSKTQVIHDAGSGAEVVEKCNPAFW